MSIINYGISTIILCPMILFLIVYIMLRKKTKYNSASIGWAADITTFVLFFSVPLSISSLWGMQYSGIIFVVSLLIAIVYTYIDWKSKKEIRVFPLLRKIWRIFFLLLSMTYFFIWLIGLTQHILLIFNY